MKHFVILSLLLALSGCRSAPDAALLAVLTHSPPNPLVTSCLSILGQDPSAELLADLQASKQNVVAGSKCVRGKYGVKSASGGHAELVSISNVRHVIPWRVTLEYSQSTGFIGGSAFLIQLQRVNGAWSIRNSKLLRIS